MIEPEQRKSRTKAVARVRPVRTEDLPYSVELWTTDKTRPERVLARAQSGPLAHAIFAAACQEYSDRHLVLRHRKRIVTKRE